MAALTAALSTGCVWHLFGPDLLCLRGGFAGIGLGELVGQLLTQPGIQQPDGTHNGWMTPADHG